MLARFDLEELRTLVFDLYINYDDLRGEIISAKVQALLEYLEKQDRLPDLLVLLKQRRPNLHWDGIFPDEPEALSPYKGLQFFDEADVSLFFGRERLTAELVDHLRQHRFLAAVGASGSGKSSVVRAGVVPAVRGGAIVTEDSNSANWPIHFITPGDEPLKALAASLTRDSESVTATKSMLADLQADTDSLDLFLYRHFEAGNGRMLLVIDQFEELFTQCQDAAAQEMFVGNLVTAVNSGQQGRLRLILTLRADFYSHAVQFEGLRPLLETRQRIVGAMIPDELRQAIKGPADRGSWTFQPGLVDTILQDVGREPGTLPLLSHALQETWTRRESRTLTLAGYQAAGGVRQAIARTADTVYAGLLPEQQIIARTIFLRLTELGEGTEDTRRRASLAELLPDGERKTGDVTAIGGDVSNILDLLARKRLVTLNEEAAKPHAEVAHEALIREWPMLQRWLDEDREGLRIHRQLTEAADVWNAADQDESYLYRGARLEAALEWVETNNGQLNQLEQHFLTTSEKRQQNELALAQARAEREAKTAQQLRQRALFLRGALVVAGVLAILAFLFAGQSSRNAQVARDSAADAATQAALAADAEATAVYN
jgi:energy-coupling factor transporter ATP-binding protein EcfA2